MAERGLPPEERTPESTEGTGESRPADRGRDRRRRWFQRPDRGVDDAGQDAAASGRVGDDERGDERGDDRATGEYFVVVCGLPGVGKTTVAEQIAERLDATMLRNDVIRKELVGDPTYSDAETAGVYHELLRRAGDRIDDGENVVVDATFKTTSFREQARGIADRLGVEFTLVKVECDQETVERRIRARTDDASDADVEVHRMFRERFDEVTGDHEVVDNSRSEAKTRQQVARLF